MSAPADGFGISAFGYRITVLTDCPAARAFLDRHLLPWLPRGLPDPEAADLVFQVSRNKDDQGFDAQAGDRFIASRDELPLIFTLLQSLIDEKLVCRLPGLIAVHAGVVAWNGRAVLLPGASQTGKTTLVTELLKRGAVYFSDEYALLDAEGRVHAYPRTLMLRNSGGWQHPTLPSAWNAATADSPAAARLILSVERGSSWKVHRIPQSEALLLLLRNTPHEVADSPGMLDHVRLAVSSAVCYMGIRGEAAESAGHVLELIADLR